VTNSSSIEKRDIRRFGVIALVFFGILCGLGVWKAKPIPIGLFGTLAFLGLCFILLPEPMRPVHAGWLRVAHFIGRAVTVLLLTLAYYLVITPSALVKRVLGGRPLPLRPDPRASSYWVERPEPAQPKERFFKRF